MKTITFHSLSEVLGLLFADNEKLANNFIEGALSESFPASPDVEHSIAKYVTFKTILTNEQQVILESNGFNDQTLIDINN